MLVQVKHLYSVHYGMVINFTLEEQRNGTFKLISGDMRWDCRSSINFGFDIMGNLDSTSTH